MFNGGKRKKAIAGIRRRYLLVALALFVCAGVPVWLAYTSSTFNTAYQRGRLAGSSPLRESVEENGFLSDISESGSPYLSIPSDSSLDPQPDKTFLVSFLVSPERFSEKERVFKMIGKYESDKPPYPGWAVALRIRDDFIRTEAYWKGVSGDGGWFVFDEFQALAGNEYVVSLFAQSDKFISMYVEELSSTESASLLAENTSGRDPLPNQGVVFSGGYPVNDITLSPTEGNLFISSHGKGRGDSALRVRGVLVAQPSIRASSRSEAEAFLSGGPTAIAERMSSGEVSLWIDQSAKDRSRFHRDLGSSGERS